MVYAFDVHGLDEVRIRRCGEDGDGKENGPNPFPGFVDVTAPRQVSVYGGRPSVSARCLSSR